MSTTLGLVLVPDEVWSRRIVDYAQALLPRISDDVQAVLGRDGLAHLSLLHVVSDQPVEEAWDEVRTLVPDVLDVQVLGVAISPNRSAYIADPATSGGLGVFLQVAAESWYVEYQQRLFDTTWYRQGEAGYYKPGMAPNPHFTLGVTGPTLGFGVASGFELPDDLLEHRIPVRPVIGRMGAHGVLETILVR